MQDGKESGAANGSSADDSADHEARDGSGTGGAQANSAEASDGASATERDMPGAWRGAFRVVLSPVAGDRDGDVRKELEFRPMGTPSADELQLYTAISSTSAALHSTLSAAHEVGQLNTYLVRLSRIAKVGLEKGFPGVAAIELTNLRNGLLALEGPRVKNEYMFRLGKWAIVFAFVAMLLIAAFRVNDFAVFVGAKDWRYSATIFGYLWIGSMVGCWLSFGIRNPQLSIDALSQPDKELLRPPLRLLFTGLLSMTLGLAFVTGAVGVSIGTFDTELLKKAALEGAMTTEAAALALLIGLFCGIGEQALSVSVGQRANQFIGEASK